MSQPENNAPETPFNPTTPEDRAKMSKTFLGAEHLPLDTTAIYEGAQVIAMGEVTLTDVEIMADSFLVKLRPLKPEPVEGQEVQDWSGFVFVATLKRVPAVRLRGQIHAAIENLDPRVRARTEKALQAAGAVAGRETQADREERLKDRLHPVGYQGGEYQSLEEALRTGTVKTMDGQVLQLPPQTAQGLGDGGAEVTDEAHASGDEGGGEKGGLLEAVLDVAKDTAASLATRAAAALRGER